MKEVYRQAIAWRVEVARLPMARPEPEAPEWYRRRANGITAYTAWADQIVQDDDLPAGQEDI